MVNNCIVATLCLVLVAATTRPSTEPAADFTSGEAILGAIPRELVPNAADGWTDLKMDEINRVLKRVIAHKSFELTLRVAVVRDDVDLNVYEVTGSTRNKIAMFVVVPHNEESRRMLLGIDANSEVLVRGVLLKAEFTKYPPPPAKNGNTIFVIVGQSSDIRRQHG